jgi:stearoyl-CoA desaturase (delta-9 desaturase)
MFKKINYFFSQCNVAPVLFLSSYQIILLLALPFYLLHVTPHFSLWVMTFALFWLTGFGITLGYHRLFSHKAFKTRPVIETITLFFASLAFQGSCLRWSFEHRIHHAHVDTDEDPYTISKGFLYAHCLWLVQKPKEIIPGVVSDLMQNPRVMFQHRFSKMCMIFSNVFIVLVMGFYTGDFLGALLLPFALRLFLVHHGTWFINSLAHTWGSKEFCNEHSAVDNFLISLVTFGEGYHNYHHTFANDYRNGIRWYHFDPTKWLIWTLHKFHLATSLRRMDHHLIKKKIIKEKTELLLEQLDERWIAYKQDLSALSDRICEKLNALSQTQKNFPKTKELKLRVKQMRRSLKNEIRQWRLTLKFLQKRAYFAS